jgi:hypothetical protein
MHGHLKRPGGWPAVLAPMAAAVMAASRIAAMQGDEIIASEAF